MTSQEHIAAIKSALAQIYTVRGELAAVQKLGENSVAELDALNAGETPDADQAAILESRLRGLSAKKSSRLDMMASAEAALAAALNEAFAQLDNIALSGVQIEAAAKSLMPWCKDFEEARKAAFELPAFKDRTAQVRWLHLRRDRGESDEIAPALIGFLESLTVQATA